MNLLECVNMFLESFPEYEQTYENHIIDYDGKILGHVFFGDVINIPLTELLSRNIENGEIKRYINFVNLMYEKGDDSVKNIVEVTILEYLGDDKSVLQRAINYFSAEVINASKRVEIFLGRY